MTEFLDEFSKEIFEQTYQFGDETIDEAHERIAISLASVEKDTEYWKEKFQEVLEDFKFVPGGRIISNAGVPLRGTTMINCFVSGFTGKDQDSMEGILDELRRQALILKSEGGYGFCADVMRPKGAFIEGIGNSSPGSVELLEMWDTQSRVITKGSGQKNERKDSKKKIRKGAQLVSLSCWHPDILEFITAKQTSGRLTKFNMSVLITDDFMYAVKNQLPWDLEFPEFDSDIKIPEGINTNPPTKFMNMKTVYEKQWDGNLKKWKENGLPTKIYKTFEDANELWDIIMESTYNRNEPGVLFVDTINKLNNLWYEEYISATNPCGEQILPVGGVCLLGSLNLTQFIKGKNWDYDKLKEVIPVAVRMMDNVNDITYVPLQIQKDNLKNKRRIGLGVMGYGSALMMMQIRYGSKKALKKTDELMNFIMNAAYQASANLAAEKGVFPLFDKEKYLQGHFVQKLNKEILKLITKHGIRNSHLLSIQPTGNTSVLSNNVSGGLEPIFMPEYIRTSMQPYPPPGLGLPTNIDFDKKIFDYSDDTNDLMTKKWHWIEEGDESLLACEYNGNIWKIDKSRGLLKEAVVKDYAVKYLQDLGKYDHTANWVSHVNNLEIDDHIRTMSVFAKYIDSAMSKTINIPNEYSYEDFKEVYLKLYETGVIKGGTTYRAGTMATVLKEKKVSGRNNKIILNQAPARPKDLLCDINHITAKGQKWVVIVGKLDEQPYEVFAFRKKSITLSPKIERGVMIKIKRGRYDLDIPDVITIENVTEHFETDEEEAFTRLCSTSLRHGVNPKFIFEQLDKSRGDFASFSKAIGRTLKKYIKDNEIPTSAKCPNCHVPDGLIYMEGCVKCKECGFSVC